MAPTRSGSSSTTASPRIDLHFPDPANTKYFPDEPFKARTRHTPVYPAAVLADSAQPELASSYLRFLCGDAGRAAFERVGFTPLA